MFDSLLGTQHYLVSAKTTWFGVRVILPGGATYLPLDLCFSKLELQCIEIQLRRAGQTKRTSSSSDQNVACFLHDTAEKLFTWR